MPTPDDFSKALFGSQHRLALLEQIATASEDALYGASLARLIEAPANQVSNDLRRLASAGLLEAIPKRGPESAQRYSRQREPFWEKVTELADTLR